VGNDVSDWGRSRIARGGLPRPVRSADAAPTSGTDPVSRMLALQGSVSNASVARLLARPPVATIQRDVGWKGDDVMDDRSKGMTKVDSGRPGGKPVRRIPIEGVDEGYAAGGAKPQVDDVGVDETGTYRPIADETREQAGGKSSGRAVVLIPESLPKLDSVEVLFHLHGFTPGWRARYPLPPPKPKPKSRPKKGSPPPAPEPPAQPTRVEPEDIETARIEQQLEASGRPMIAILPQGTSHSFFGHDRAEVNVKTYIDQVFAQLGDADWPSGEKPQHVGGIVLSAHSGAGHALSNMLHSKEHLVPGTDRPAELEDPSKRSVTDTAFLEGLVLFDTINPAGQTSTTTQYTHVLSFLKSQLEHDLSELHLKWKLAQNDGTPDAEVARSQEKWLVEAGFRFRGFATAGGYGTSFNALKGEVTAWFNRNAAALGGPKSCVYQALFANYTIAPAGADHMHMIGGTVGKDGTREHENLRAALDELPKPKLKEREGCDPIPAKPLPKAALAKPKTRATVR
jgi:hypothetical protein